jgi:putative aminopeptidase FrvX
MICSHSPIQPFLDLLAALVRTPSVVGSEEPFFRVLQRELELHGVSVRRYQGILEAYGGRPESLIVSAHVDRHGVVASGPGEFQYAAYVARAQGDLDGNSISEQMAETIGGRFAGARVEAYDPWHGGYLGQGEILSSFRCEKRNNVIFEIPALLGLRPGTPVAYLEHLDVREDCIAAQLDNVLTVALAVDMFRRGYQGTVLFTAEEEAGRSWRYILAWLRRHEKTTQRLLVFDTSPYQDAEAANAQEIVLRRKDANATFAEPLVAELTEICDRLEITHTYKDAFVDNLNEIRASEGLPPRSLGRTELGRVVVATNGEVNGATLQIPTIGYHTSQETASLSAVNAALQVTSALIDQTA